MQRLPVWNFTNIIPAFNDLESGTSIEMVAKVYGAMNELIDEYNKFVENTNKEIDEFETSSEKNYEEFAVGLRQEFQDFIDIINLKCMELENYVKDNLKETIYDLEGTGFITDELKKLYSEILNSLSVLNSRMNAFTTLAEGSTTGDAELTDARTDYKGVTHENVGTHIREVSSELSSEIVEAEEIIGTPFVLWEQGGIDTTTGTNTGPDYENRDVFVRTSNYIKVGKGVKIEFPATDSLIFYNYDINYNLIGTGNSPTDNTFYIRFRMFHKNSTEITPEYASENVKVVYKDETSINNRINNIFEMLTEINGIIPLQWEQGSISSGFDTPPDYEKHNLFVRTSNYIKVGKGIIINFPTTDTMYIVKYDANKNFIENSTDPNVIPTDNVFYIRLRMFHKNSAEITPDYASENVVAVYEGSSPLAGSKVCTYGDSITKTGTWQNIVKEKLHIGKIYNLGWSDSAVTMENKTLFINADGTYNSNPIGGTVKPEGTTEVQCSFCHDDRISYIPTDSEVVLVMGGTNDLYRNKPIGTITNDGNYDENTFIGALISTVQKIQTRVPNSTIVLMTPITKPSEQGSITTFVNNNGNTIVDFVNAVRNAADYIGCGLIDVHTCGITLFNSASKLSDGTHPNTAGHELIAKTVIGGLKNIFTI